MAPTLRDVAREAGVSVATASRVAAGAPGVRPETRERVELRHARAPLRFPRPRLHRHRRAPRASARQPDLPGARAGDGAPGGRGRLRDDPLQHRRLRPARGGVRAHAGRTTRRRHDLHLERGDRPALGSPALPPPAGRRSPNRLRERLRRLARGHVRRGRRTCGGQARDRASAGARPSPHRLRGRPSARAADPRQGRGPGSGAEACGHRARRPRLRMRRSLSAAGRPRSASCSRRRAARPRPSSARAT